MELFLHLFRYENLENNNILKRQEEIETCAYLNYNNPSIKKIHVFVSPDDEEYFRELLPKAEFIVSEKIPTYKTFFNYASISLKRDTICCICKNDIEIGRPRMKLISCMKREEIYSLTAYEKYKNIENNSKYYYDNYTGKHDAFIFMNPVKIDLDKIDFIQDTPHIENRLHIEFTKNKYKILNPCNQIPMYYSRQYIVEDKKKYDPICSQSEIKNSEVKPCICFQTIFQVVAGRLRILKIPY